MIIEGTFATHEKTFKSQVKVDEQTGLIVSIGENIGNADYSFDNSHRIFPGFIDLHVHCREDSSGKQNYKEDFLTASQAAINGGVTALMDMPNNPKPPIDDASYKEKKELAKKALVDVLLYAGIGPKTSPLPFKVPYKIFMGPSVGDLFFDKDIKVDDAIQKYSDSFITFHCESADFLKQYEKEETHEKRRPPICEIAAIQRAIGVCKKNDVRLNIAHISTKRGMEEVINAKKEGFQVKCEICPHHIFFDENNKQQSKYPAFMQMNPPLRKKEDRLFLLEQLKKGNIDFLTTDHAPHTVEEKEKGISGVPMLDAYGLFVTWLLQQGVSEQAIAKACSYNPGKIFSEFRNENYGEVKEGFVGSFTILNLNKPLTFAKEHIKSKCAWSPFEGFTFPGSVAMTVVRGRAYNNQQQ